MSQFDSQEVLAKEVLYNKVIIDAVITSGTVCNTDWTICTVSLCFPL